MRQSYSESGMFNIAAKYQWWKFDLAMYQSWLCILPELLCYKYSQPLKLDIGLFQNSAARSMPCFKTIFLPYLASIHIHIPQLFVLLCHHILISSSVTIIRSSINPQFSSYYYSVCCFDIPMSSFVNSRFLPISIWWLGRSGLEPWVSIFWLGSPTRPYKLSSPTSH